MKLQKNLPRLLVIFADDSVRSNIVTLLSGYGYYVDYESKISKGIKRFRQTKHPIAILDVKALPENEDTLLKLFTVYKRNPMILVAAEKKDEHNMIRYLQSGVYDIIPLPLEVEHLDFVLKRLIDHSQLLFKFEFLKLFAVTVGLTFPLIILFLLKLYGKQLSSFSF